MLENNGAKIVIYSILLFGTLSGNIPPKNTIKNIIWDAGSTLTTVNRWHIAQEMGLTNIISMILLIGSPYTIQKTMFKVLEDHAGPQKAPSPDDLLSCDAYDMPLPHFMSDTWLCSRIPNKELIKQINEAVNQWKPKRTVSPSERKVIRTILRTALSAKILGKHTRCPRIALKLVKQCDDHGYNQYILSNFEKEAFERAYKNPENQQLFDYIPRENIMVSGDCGMIKPYKCMYEHFLRTYNLDPQECLLIDDRPENVKGAQSIGIYGITLDDQNYHKLERTLKKWHIID
jgi:FMN phosphatase YigB (HAD superfamily)